MCLVICWDLDARDGNERVMMLFHFLVEGFMIKNHRDSGVAERCSRFMGSGDEKKTDDSAPRPV